MEQTQAAFLLCNEPNPTTPTNGDIAENQPTQSAPGKNHLCFEHQFLVETKNRIWMKNSNHQSNILQNCHTNYSPPGSDSSGYDSIISSLYDYDDSSDDFEDYYNDFEEFSHRKATQFSHTLQQSSPQSYGSSTMNSSKKERSQSPHKGKLNNDGTINGQIDQHLLADNERIIKNMLKIEDRYVPWSVDTKIYRSNADTNWINENVRSELVGWMFDVCEYSKCEASIFTLSVNYLDRFLLGVCSLPPKSQLQLVGLVCMLTASKIRQCTSFDLNYLSFTSDYSFSCDDIKNYELLLLKELEWNVSSIVANDYLDYILVIVSRLMEIFESNCTDNNVELIKLNKNSNGEQLKNGQCSIINSANVDRSIFSDAEANDNNDNYNHRKRFKSVHYYENNNNNYFDHYYKNDGQALMIVDDQFSKKQTATSKLLNTSSSQMNNNVNVKQSMHNHFGQYHNNNPLHHLRIEQADAFNAVEDEQGEVEIGNNDAEDNHPSCSSYLSSNVEKIRRHANTFISVCSTELSFVSVKPSIIAAACVATAIRGIDNDDGIDTLNRNAALPEKRTTGQMNNKRSNKPNSNKPMNLYKSFVLAMEKQMAIDSHILEFYATKIENLFASKVNSIVKVDESKNSPEISSKLTIATLSTDTATANSSIGTLAAIEENSSLLSTMAGIKKSKYNHYNHHNRNYHLHYSHRNMIHTPTHSTNIVASDLSFSSNCTLSPSLITSYEHNNHNQQYYYNNHHHSYPGTTGGAPGMTPVNIHSITRQPASSNNNGSTNNHQIHTTFAQVASAKQFLLREERQRNIRSSLYDTTNGGGIAINSSNTALAQSINGTGAGGGTMDNLNLNIKCQQEINHLIAYLEAENRENIPLLILNVPGSENQENVPPNVLTPPTSSSNDLGTMLVSEDSDNEVGNIDDENENEDYTANIWF